MNPHTGAIAEFENAEDAKAAGHTVPLTRDEAGDLMPRNRAERRAWARGKGEALPQPRRHPRSR